MAKRGFGKLVVLAAAAGAAAAGISYLRKYHSFNKELEEEFHDFEGEDEEDYFDEDEEEDVTPEPEEKAAKNPDTSRKYISLNASTDELKVAAKDMVSAAGSMADAAKNVLKDAAAIISDTAMEAASAARDTAQIAKAKVHEKTAGEEEALDGDLDEDLEFDEEAFGDDIFQDEEPAKASEIKTEACTASEGVNTADSEEAAGTAGATDAGSAETAGEAADEIAAADESPAEPADYASPDPAGSGTLSQEGLSEDTVKVVNPEDAPRLEPEPTTIVEEIEE